MLRPLYQALRFQMKAQGEAKSPTTRTRRLKEAHTVCETGTNRRVTVPIRVMDFSPGQDKTDEECFLYSATTAHLTVQQYAIFRIVWALPSICHGVYHATRTN